MNRGYLYAIFVTIPLVFTICVNLFINLKYGRDSYLKKFSKNYERFKLIFAVQRLYFLTWTLTMIPSILYSLYSKDTFMPLYTWILALQPMCIIFSVAMSRTYKIRFRHEQMRRAGLVQTLMASITEGKESTGNFSFH